MLCQTDLFLAGRGRLLGDGRGLFGGGTADFLNDLGDLIGHTGELGDDLAELVFTAVLGSRSQVAAGQGIQSSKGR